MDTLNRKRYLVESGIRNSEKGYKCSTHTAKKGGPERVPTERVDSQYGGMRQVPGLHLSVHPDIKAKCVQSSVTTCLVSSQVNSHHCNYYNPDLRKKKRWEGCGGQRGNTGKDSWGCTWSGKGRNAAAFKSINLPLRHIGRTLERKTTRSRRRGNSRVGAVLSVAYNVIRSGKLEPNSGGIRFSYRGGK